MGSTYANVTVVDTTVDEVVATLGPTVALVAGAADGTVVVFAEQDEFDGFSAGLTARLLSTALGRPALEVAVFDDDLLQYQLFVDGEVVDEAAVVDGNIITSRNPDDVPAFTAALANALAS